MKCCCFFFLKASYFDPVQLADIAKKLDDAEKAHLTEGDISTSHLMKVLEVRHVPVLACLLARWSIYWPLHVNYS